MLLQREGESGTRLVSIHVRYNSLMSWLITSARDACGGRKAAAVLRHVVDLYCGRAVQRCFLPTVSLSCPRLVGSTQTY